MSQHQVTTTYILFCVDSYQKPKSFLASMEGSNRDRGRQGGKLGAHSQTLQSAVQTPSHAANIVVQTSLNQDGRNETDLQRAITDYQNKMKKQTGGSGPKTKNTTNRSHHKNSNNNNDSRYGAPISQKRLADTYMVGGCSMDLNSAVSSQKKAAMLLNSMQNTGLGRQQQAGIIQHSSSTQKYSNTVRQRHSNQKATQNVQGNGSGPMQLEPNPVFSIIEQHMEKLSKTAESKDQGGDNMGSRGTDKNGEYIAYVDGQNILQHQKMTQSSYEDRASSDQFDGDDEEQVVAFSSKRKAPKNSKTMAKKSPKSNSFINNSTINDMSNLWSKYRRNLHETQQKTGPDNQSSNQRGKVHHSQSRQGYLMAQHKQNQQMQLQLMHDKVNQYQKKLIEQLAQQTEAFNARPTYTKKKERFSRSIGREFQNPKCRNALVVDVDPVQTKDSHLNYTQQHKQEPMQMDNTEREAGLDEEIQQVMRNHNTKDGREVSRSSATTDQESLVTQQQQPQQAKNSSQPRTTAANRGQQSQGKNPQVNGKVSTSIKATWTVNRSSHAQNPSSRLGNNSGLNYQTTLQQRDASFGAEPAHEYQAEGRELCSSQLKDKSRGGAQQTNDQNRFGNSFALSPSSKLGTTNSSHAQVNKSRFDPNSGSNAQRKKPSTSTVQQQQEPQPQQQQQNPQLGNARRKFSKEGSATNNGMGSNDQNLQVHASFQSTQDIMGSPGLPKQNSLGSNNKDKDGAGSSNNGGATPVSSAKVNTKREPFKGNNKNFEQLMMAGSMLQSQKQASERVPAEEKEETKKTQSQPVMPKEFLYKDPGVKIGNGKFGPVNLIIKDRKLWALKIVPKTTIDKTKRIEHVKNEKQILKMLRKNAIREQPPILRSGASQRNPTRAGRREDAQDDSFEGTSMSRSDNKEPLSFIMRLEDTFVDAENVNFVFEYLPGQDLFWVLQNEHNLYLGKDRQRRDWVLFYGAEILLALDTLHSRHIIYRDMKPDNVMLDYEGHIKLIDFGFAKKLCERNSFRTKTNCGTIGYTAPEILIGLTQGYSFSIDIWSFGIMLAELLSGSLPFQEKDDPQKIQEQILAGQLQLNKEGIDQVARDFLSQIFQRDAELRPSLDTLKKHRLFMHDKPSDYWSQIASKSYQEVPYTPNPLKYSYLLQNQYPDVSNLSKNRQAPNAASRCETPVTTTKPSEQQTTEDNEGTEAVKTHIREGKSVSPSPEFGGSRGAATNVFKPNAAIGMKQKRPTNMERDHNVGLFGQGGGDFDAKGNMNQNSPIVFDQSPTLGKKKQNSLLGDFTLYRVNKEFENF